MHSKKMAQMPKISKAMYARKNYLKQLEDSEGNGLVKVITGIVSLFLIALIHCLKKFVNIITLGYKLSC